MAARLPPLAALRTFEAAARHQNFRRAGAELHITHGAISHQMKALERELGVALFHRRSRGVELTEPGRALAATVREALDRIARGVAELRARPHRALTVSVLPAFATHWLIPRLADFNRRHPDIDINVRAGQALADFATEDVDLAVRYGGGKWPGLTAVRLAHEDVFPVCSPRFNGGRLPKTLGRTGEGAAAAHAVAAMGRVVRALGVNGGTIAPRHDIQRDRHAAARRNRRSRHRAVAPHPGAAGTGCRPAGAAGAAQRARRPVVFHRLSRRRSNRRRVC